MVCLTRPPARAAHLHSMTSRRRVHDQAPRDDFTVHEDLGVATVRTDHPDGTATYSVQVAVPGYRGLHLTTGVTVTAREGTFTVSTADGSFPDLVAALTVAARNLTGLEPAA